MARARSPRRKLLTSLAAWAVALVIFFPVLWMILTSFKTEGEAVTIPPTFLFFDWTLENYGIKPRGNAQGAPGPLVHYISMRMENRGGAKSRLERPDMMKNPPFFPLGQGGVDFPALKAHLDKIGWRGFLTVELDTSPFRPP